MKYIILLRSFYFNLLKLRIHKLRKKWYYKDVPYIISSCLGIGKIRFA